MESKPSESIYERIKQGAKHPKVLKAINNIKEACDYLDNHKMSITIAEVGRITEKVPGGPTAPSLRNRQDYVDYVKARAGEQILPPAVQGDKVVSVRTGNADADAYIYSLEVELRVAKKQIAQLRALLRSGEFDLEASLQDKKLVLAALPGFEPKQLPAAIGNRELAEVLVKILDPQHLETFGMLIEKERIKSPERNSKVFLEKTEVELLKKEVERQRELLKAGQT